MFKRFGLCVVLAAAFSFSAPVFARAMSQSLELTQPAMIGSTTLAPGSYKVTADLNSDRVQVEQQGKLIATVEGKTVTLHRKSPYAAIVMDGNRISEIQFSGKIQAIQIPKS